MPIPPPIAFASSNRFPGTDEILLGRDLRGKFAVITGGSGGLGLATAKALAKAGVEVVVGSRPGAKLDAAVAELRTMAKAPVHGIGVDLGDLDSVDRFADEILELAKPVDFLVNNAGVIGPKQLSPSGVEMGFMTNVVGHAVLASRLAVAMPNGARIACLSSFGHHYSSVVFDDINFERRPYSAWASYGQSKTGCALMAVKLSHALRHRAIDAFSVHPGAIITEMGRAMTSDDHAESMEKTGALLEDDFKTPDQGAATTIWAITEPHLSGQGGLYLQDCAVAPVRDEPDYRTGVMRYAQDPALADRLWETVSGIAGRDLERMLGAE